VKSTHSTKGDAEIIQVFLGKPASFSNKTVDLSSVRSNDPHFTKQFLPW